MNVFKQSKNVGSQKMSYCTLENNSYIHVFTKLNIWLDYNNFLNPRYPSIPLKVTISIVTTTIVTTSIIATTIVPAEVTISTVPCSEKLH